MPETVIPSDYVFCSTTDPSTQLFTSLVSDPTPSWLPSLFLEKEFLQDNFNRTRYLIGNRLPVGVLSEQTWHELDSNQRYLDILASFALGNEMRAICVTNGSCWGTLSLHRERATSDYTAREASFLAQLTPHIAEGLRKALLLDQISLAKVPDGPGVLILAEDLSVVAMTTAAEHWLMELAEAESSDKHLLPHAVLTVVARLLGIEYGTIAEDITPKVRLRTPSGYWLVLYASWLRSSGEPGQISVIFELAQPMEIAPLVMQAYQLTKREGEVIQCILRGWSTTQIAGTLYISSHTVQDHLKAIFESRCRQSQRAGRTHF
jgi:hypothetical protein